MTRRWPIRWRLAAVSAALTFVILLAFAFAIGRLAADRIRADFHDELRTTAGRLAFDIEVTRSAGALPEVAERQLQEVAMANRAVVRIVSDDGAVLWASPGAPELETPPAPGVSRLGSLRVATAPVFSSAVGIPTTYVQYARSHTALEATVHRLWLFLGAGVLAGTALAALAGFAVARRAMRPISELTATAREIASTGDPSRRVPTPETEDEVAELARTLDEMLRSLDAARARSEHLIQAQREFVADASHELRTPLTSVLANLELLAASLEKSARSDTDEHERAETVGAALRSTRRMSRLVSDLLLLARADAGHPAPRRACDLAEIVEDAVREVEAMAGERKLEVRAERPVPVEGNPDELHRLALNLLENSVRHTPEGTRVSVVVDARNGAALLEVADDGPGLPEGAEEQVFGRFVRGAGPADQAGTGGTGLGLAIVRAVVVSHDGEVEAGASPAGGARFTVRLPLSAVGARPPAIAPPAT